MAVKKNILTIASDSGGTSSGSGAGGGGYSTLQYGSSGASVKELQQTLNRLGYNVGTADGIFGNNTKNAVLQYQRDNGLTADGIVGANTWNALRTPVTPTSTPSVDYAGIIADLDKQQAGFQNAAAPTVTAKTEAALEDKKAGTTGAVSDGGKNSGIPSTAGLKPTAVAYDDSGPDYVAAINAATPAADVTKPGLVPVTPTNTQPDNPVTQPDATVGNLPETGVGYPSPTATQPEKPVGNQQTPAPSVYQTAISDIDAASGRAPEPVSPTDTPTINYAAALDAAPTESGRPERGDNKYEQGYDSLLDELRNMPAFRFDKDSDPLWAALAKQYRREGQRATADALGQAAGLTGGIASSAAVTAASQAGDYYASQLNDRLLDVYNQRYQEYVEELSRKAGLLPDYLGGANFLEGQYQTDLGQFNADRSAAMDQQQRQIQNAMAITESLGYVPDEATAQILGIPVGTSTQSKTYQDWQMEYNNRQQEYDQQQRQIQNAMAIVESIGYVPDQSIANIMGLPVGTSTQSKAYQDWQMRFSEQQEAFDQAYKNQQLALNQQELAANQAYRNQQLAIDLLNAQNAGSTETAGYSSIYDQMAAAGVTGLEEAKAWMLQNYKGISKDEREQYAQYYANHYSGGDAIGFGLKALFPDGVVTDPQVWAAVESEYGSDYLKNNGFKFLNLSGDIRADNAMQDTDIADVAAKKWDSMGYNITNAHTSGTVTISGLGTVSYADLARMVAAGTVKETVNGTRKTVTYSLAG